MRKVAEAPAAVIVDNMGEGKILKTVKGGNSAGFRKSLEEAVKKLAKK
jgi:hypothetical protein